MKIQYLFFPFIPVIFLYIKFMHKFISVIDLLNSFSPIIYSSYTSYSSY